MINVIVLTWLVASAYAVISVIRPLRPFRARWQAAFAHMEAYLRSLRQQVRRILTEHGIGETKAIREKVEEFAIHAYGAGA